MMQSCPPKKYSFILGAMLSVATTSFAAPTEKVPVEVIFKTKRDAEVYFTTHKVENLKGSKKEVTRALIGASKHYRPLSTGPEIKRPREIKQSTTTDVGSYVYAIRYKDDKLLGKPALCGQVEKPSIIHVATKKLLGVIGRGTKCTIKPTDKKFEAKHSDALSYSTDRRGLRKVRYDRREAKFKVTKESLLEDFKEYGPYYDEMNHKQKQRLDKFIEAFVKEVEHAPVKDNKKTRYAIAVALGSDGIADVVYSPYKKTKGTRVNIFDKKNVSIERGERIVLINPEEKCNQGKCKLTYKDYESRGTARFSGTYYQRLG